jgi:hypothetical protein
MLFPPQNLQVHHVGILDGKELEVQRWSLIQMFALPTEIQEEESIKLHYTEVHKSS